MSDTTEETRHTRLLLLVLLALVLGGILIAIIGANGARSTPTAPADAVAAPAPAVTATPTSPGDIIWEATGETDIYWAFTNDPAVNCAPEGWGGCFRPEFPDSIFVSSGLSDTAQRYIVLHELAHLHQHRSGLPLDECAADAQALAWGADPTQLYYAPNC